MDPRYKGFGPRWYVNDLKNSFPDDYIQNHPDLNINGFISIIMIMKIYYINYMIYMI